MTYGLPSNQTVNVVGGRERARNVRVGAKVWALDGERTITTTVTDVSVDKARRAVDVLTDRSAFTVAPDQLLRSPDGWVHAADAAETVLAWTPARKLRRRRLTIRPGYDLGCRTETDSGSDAGPRGCW